MWCNISTPDALFGLQILFDATLHANVKVYLSNFVQKPCWYFCIIKLHSFLFSFDRCLFCLKHEQM